MKVCHVGTEAGEGTMQRQQKVIVASHSMAGGMSEAENLEAARPGVLVAGF